MSKSYQKGVTATLTFVMVDASDASAVITTGTPVESITKDGGTQAACTNAAVHEGNGQWSLVLTATEMDADSVGVLVTLANAIPVNLSFSTDAGLSTDTAQAGAAGTITLASGESATNDFHNGNMISIVGGTGVGQSRIITDYVGSTKVATVGSNWATNPTSSSVYRIDPLGMIALTAADVNAEVDTALADIHLDHLLAADYDPASKPGVSTALLNELVESDAGVSRFTSNALEQGPSGSAPTAAAVADAVWDEARSGHTTAGTFGEGILVQDVNSTGLASINAEVDTALADIHLDHAFAVDYDPASPPGVATALFNELIESDAGVSRFTVNALEQGPSGSGASAAAIADAVWDEARSGHVTAGSFGEGVLVEDLNTAAKNSVNAEADTALSDYAPATVTSIFAEAVETGVTLKQALRLMGAALGGELSGAASTTITIEALGNPGTNRIVATVDADGNRSALTLTP